MSRTTGGARRKNTSMGLVLASLLTACASPTSPQDPPPVVEGSVDAPQPVPEPEVPFDALEGGLHVECDRVRLVVPRRHEADLRLPPPGSDAPFRMTLKGLSITTRDVFPDVVISGDDLSLVAEGSVRLTRDVGGGTFYREGPFRTFIVRNGAMLRR